MKNAIRERMSLFIDTVTVSEIVEKTALKKANLYRIKAGENFSIENLEQILLAYPTLNRTWLINGTGEMWLDSNKNDFSNKSELNEPPVHYGKVQNTEGVLEKMQREILELQRQVKELNDIYKTLKK